MQKPALRSWQNAVDAADDLLKTVAPPALIEYVVAAELIVLGVASTPYAFAALMFDGTSTGNETRRFATVVPMAQRRARAWITRSGSFAADGYAAQAATTIETTTSGGIGGAAADKIASPSPVSGSLGYLDVGAAAPQVVAAVLTGDDDAENPIIGIPLARMIELPESKTTAVEEFEVYLADGFGLSPVERSNDCELI